MLNQQFVTTNKTTYDNVMRNTANININNFVRLDEFHTRQMMTKWRLGSTDIKRN